MPVQPQALVTRNNVGVDVAAVACFNVVGAVKSVVAIKYVGVAIDRVAWYYFAAFRQL